MSKRSTGLIFVGGGLAAIAGAVFAWRKSTSTTDDITRALAGQPDPDTGEVKHNFDARLTGYWPFAATESEKKMEGGLKDRKGKPLYTLEMHQAGKAPYVSVSGDDSIFPYGQRLSLDVWPGLTFRVVDTGSHFRGVNKVYRVVGREPLDICVDSSKTVVPKEAVATIYPGDNFAGGKAVATSGLKDQTVLGHQDVVNALARGDLDTAFSLLKGRRS